MNVILSGHAEELLDAALARRPGVAPSEVLESALEALVEKDLPAAPLKMTPDEAVADIRNLRKGVTLNGVRIKDLINEGRRF
jgi:hypothetical protein